MGFIEFASVCVSLRRLSGSTAHTLTTLTAVESRHNRFGRIDKFLSVYGLSVKLKNKKESTHELGQSVTFLSLVVVHLIVNIVSLSNTHSLSLTILINSTEIILSL